MGYRDCELYVSHTFPAHLLFSDFHTAPVAYDTPVADSLVFSAVAFVVLRRAEDLLAEESVPFRLVRPVVDSLRLEDFSG